MFVTGGTGFIGKWLLESFARASDVLDLHARMTVLTRNMKTFTDEHPRLARHPAIRYIEGDVRDFTWPEEPYYAVIHGAAQASAELNREYPLLMTRTITEGTRNVLEMAKDRGVRRFLFISSGAVYGEQPADMAHTPEHYRGAPDSLDPGSAYGESKRLGELLCSIYCARYGIETIAARCFAFVGPYLNLDIHFAIGNFIRDGLKGGPIIVNGDGTPLRSYLYASDLAIWLWVLLLSGKAGQAYNVGSEEAVSIAELAACVAACFGQRTEVAIRGRKDPDKPVGQYVPDTTKARTELGLRQHIDLTSAVKKTVEWHRAV